MNNCPNCGSKIEVGDTSCKVCGTQVNNVQQVQVNNQQVNASQMLQLEPQVMNNVLPSQSTQVESLNVDGTQQSSVNTQTVNDSQPSQSFQNDLQFMSSIQPPQPSGQPMDGIQMLQTESQISDNSQGTVNNQSDQYINQEEEYLVSIYVGKNYEKIKKGRYSICTALFGVPYIFYRKMWLFGFILLFGNIIINIFLKSLSDEMFWLINIFVACYFNKIYIGYATDAVRKIKKDNSDKSIDQLSEICKKKGGTTIWPIIVFIIFYVVYFYMFINYTIDSINQMYDDKVFVIDHSADTNIVTIGSVSMEIPKYMKQGIESSESGISTVFHASGSDYDCALFFLKTYTVKKGVDEKLYLETLYPLKSNFEKVTINKHNWYYALNDDKGYRTNTYVIKKDDVLYIVSFVNNINTSFVDRDGYCSSAHEMITSSLKVE